MIIETRKQLDEMCECFLCGNADSPFYFHGYCHLSSPTWTYYEDGEIVIECAECKKEIARIKVAD